MANMTKMCTMLCSFVYSGRGTQLGGGTTFGTCSDRFAFLLLDLLPFDKRAELDASLSWIRGEEGLAKGETELYASPALEESTEEGGEEERQVSTEESLLVD